MTIPLNAKAILDSAEFQSGVDKMRSSGTGASTEISSAFSAMGLGAVAQFATITGAIAGTVKVLSDMSNEAMDDETIMTRLGVTLEDMGRSGDASAAGLEKTAMNLQAISGVNHDEILAAYNAIARFENLDTSAMDRIVKDSIDMFAGGEGGGVAENANTIARVLETGVIPRTWGFSVALRTAIQDEVKAGDTTKALSDILGTLEQRFGGQAAANLTTTAGQYKLLTADIKTMEEEIGQKLLPTEKAIIQVFDLAITAHDKVSGALEEHATNVIKTSDSYREYEQEMIRAKMVAEGNGAQYAETDAKLKMHEFTVDILTKRYGFLTEAEYAMIKATYAVGYQSDATKEALEQQMPVLDDLKGKTDDVAIAQAKAAQALSDSNEAVQFATQWQQEYESNAKSMAEAEKRLQDDRAAGWWETSDKIRDDKQAIEDLEKAHTKALLQMIVDVETYKWEQDKSLSPEDVLKKALKLQLAYGLITQAEYDATMQALALADAINAIPTAPGQGTGAKGKPGHDFGGGGFEAGTPGWLTIPGGYPNDSFPMMVSSGEQVAVIPAGGSPAGFGGGTVLNNYGTLLIQGHEDISESAIRQLRP
jgi:hypothetical protein